MNNKTMVPIKGAMAFGFNTDIYINIQKRFSPGGQW